MRKQSERNRGRRLQEHCEITERRRRVGHSRESHHGGRPEDPQPSQKKSVSHLRGGERECSFLFLFFRFFGNDEKLQRRPAERGRHAFSWVDSSLDSECQTFLLFPCKKRGRACGTALVYVRGKCKVDDHGKKKLKRATKLAKKPRESKKNWYTWHRYRTIF